MTTTDDMECLIEAILSTTNLEEDDVIRSCLVTLIEMLEDRGYGITNVTSDYIEASPTIEPSTLPPIYIFIERTKLNKDTLNRMMSYKDSLNLQHVIVIYSGSMTPHGKALVTHISSLLTIEPWEILSLSFNPTKHIFVPPHKKVVGEELEDVVRIGAHRLPSMSRDDAIARYYRFLPGDIIRIERKDLVVYRRVR